MHRATLPSLQVIDVFHVGYIQTMGENAFEARYIVKMHSPPLKALSSWASKSKEGYFNIREHIPCYLGFEWDPASKLLGRDIASTSSVSEHVESTIFLLYGFAVVQTCRNLRGSSCGFPLKAAIEVIVPSRATLYTFTFRVQGGCCRFNQHAVNNVDN